MHRLRKAKIIATLGPSSSSPDTIRALFDAGADLFRLNFSHGAHAEHANRFRAIRSIESDVGRPIGILLDLQGPKLRLGRFKAGPVMLARGTPYRLDLDPSPGGSDRAPLPHPEIFAALDRGSELLIDDGRVRLRVEDSGADFAETRVVVGGEVRDHKGVNVPGVMLPLSALTVKDRRDLEYGLSLGADWIAQSFVQRPEDVSELRELVDGRASIMVKLEKPSALDHLERIVELTDAVMVARGDLGVELPPERVPTAQKRIVQACRQAGKPVVVATHMLDSMVHAPVPTRAEASDVASAVYEGVDSVMLSAETAAGEYPLESVRMMDRIITQVESDPHYRNIMDANHPTPDSTRADAICSALRQVAAIRPTAAIVTYTSSGVTAQRAARERPEAPILSLTPEMATARRLALVWGVHAVLIDPPTVDTDVPHVISEACRIAVREGFARHNEALAIAAGIPFGTAGTINLLHLARITDESVGR